jgi:hypothetical protein
LSSFAAGVVSAAGGGGVLSAAIAAGGALTAAGTSSLSAGGGGVLASAGAAPASAATIAGACASEPAFCKSGVAVAGLAIGSFANTACNATSVVFSPSKFLGLRPSSKLLFLFAEGAVGVFLYGLIGDGVLRISQRTPTPSCPADNHGNQQCLNHTELLNRSGGYYYLDFCTVRVDATFQLLIEEVYTFQTFINLQATIFFFSGVPKSHKARKEIGVNLEGCRCSGWTHNSICHTCCFSTIATSGSDKNSSSSS